MSAGSSQLARLARKYERLIELRRQASEQPPPELRSLAEEFPGALRELDALPLAELERRLESARQALSGGPTEALLEWLVAYHGLMRAALAIKRRLRGEKQPSLGQARGVLEALARETGIVCSVELVREVAAPPRGRLNELVFARLSSRSGLCASALSAALFSESRAT